MDRKKRAGCDEIVKKFQELHQNCKDNPEYSTKRLQPRTMRKRTHLSEITPLTFSNVQEERIQKEGKVPIPSMEPIVGENEPMIASPESSIIFHNPQTRRSDTSNVVRRPSVLVDSASGSPHINPKPQPTTFKEVHFTPREERGVSTPHLIGAEINLQPADTSSAKEAQEEQTKVDTTEEFPTIQQPAQSQEASEPSQVPNENSNSEPGVESDPPTIFIPAEIVIKKSVRKYLRHFFSFLNCMDCMKEKDWMTLGSQANNSSISTHGPPT